MRLRRTVQAGFNESARRTAITQPFRTMTGPWMEKSGRFSVNLSLEAHPLAQKIRWAFDARTE
jgi:hypothetical protein